MFQDGSAIYSNGPAASLSSAQSIGMWTNDVPGSDGSYVQEAYGSIWPAFDAVTVTENDYWLYPGVLGQLVGEAANCYS